MHVLLQFSNASTEAGQITEAFDLFGLAIPTHQPEAKHIENPSSTACSLKDLPRVLHLSLTSFVTQHKQHCSVSLVYWGWGQTLLRPELLWK